MTHPVARRSASVEETERLGEALAPALRAGDVLALSGPLGAGKTRLITGLARGLAAQARVRSPTYTLVNEYPGRVTLVHLDLYRVSAAELDGLGLEDHLEDAALAVEWGEKLPAALAVRALTLEFEIVSEHERVITAHAPGSPSRAQELLQAWQALAVSPAAVATPQGRDPR